MSQLRNIVLTGFMGTGKTTVGRLLADDLDFAFVDTDELIEKRCGAIAAIFESDGEARFRDEERKVASELAASAGFVIATGGKLMLDDDNAAELANTGRVFCLVASASEIRQRLGEDASVRPLLAGGEPLARIEALLTERESGYARFEQVPTDGRTPDEIVADLVERLGLQAC